MKAVGGGDWRDLKSLDPSWVNDSKELMLLLLYRGRSKATSWRNISMKFYERWLSQVSIVRLRRMRILSYHVCVDWFQPVCVCVCVDWFQPEFSGDACPVSSGAEWPRSVDPTERTHQEATWRAEGKIHQTTTGKASDNSPIHPPTYKPPTHDPPTHPPMTHPPLCDP